MGYTNLVEVCGNCHSLVTWAKNGDAIHNCNNLNLQFITRVNAVELGLLQEV